jgi:hypothetical protein
VSNQVKSRKKRPTIVVERVYIGDKSMKKIFQQLAAEQVRRNLEQHGTKNVPENY